MESNNASSSPDSEHPSKSEQERIEAEFREDEDRYVAILSNAPGLISTKEIEPEDGFNYCVLVYFLFPEPDKEGNVGMWNILRSFSSKEKATAYAEEITAKYIVRQVLVTKTCQWNVLSRKSVAPKQLVSTKTGKIISLDNMLEQQQTHRVEQAKEQIEQDRILRQIQTTDPSKMTDEQRRVYLAHLVETRDNLINQVRALHTEITKLSN